MKFLSKKMKGKGGVSFSDEAQVRKIPPSEFAPVNQEFLYDFREYINRLQFPTQKGGAEKKTRVLEVFARGFLEWLRTRPELIEKYGVREDNIRATASALAQEFRLPEGTYRREEPDYCEVIDERSK